MGISQAQLGWMAAVLDLKGMCIRKRNKTRATPQLVLVVESREHAVIRKLAEMTGSNPEAKRPADIKEWMRRGCVEHCPQPHQHVHDEKWSMPLTSRWTVTGVVAGIVLYNLAPYFVSDKPYAAFAEEALRNAVLTGQGSGASKAAIARLVTLGWDLPPELASDLLELAALAAGVEKAKSA